VSAQPQPYSTQTRIGRLGYVFNQFKPTEFDHQVARLFVLAEDLRIELHGISETSLPSMDLVSAAYRRHYFLRRSLATLYEFAESLEATGRQPAFAHVHRLFDPKMRKFWDRALRLFDANRPLLDILRNNIGGHFGDGATKVAIRALTDQHTGSLDVMHYPGGKGGAIFKFAEELTAVAFKSHCDDKKIKVSIHRAIKLSRLLYCAAIEATYCLTSVYIWDRFGK